MNQLLKVNEKYQELLCDIRAAEASLDALLQKKKAFIEDICEGLGHDIIKDIVENHGSPVGKVITAANWNDLAVGDVVECLKADFTKVGSIGDESFLVGETYEVGVDDCGDFGPIDEDGFTIEEGERSYFKFRIVKPAKDNVKE